MKPGISIVICTYNGAKLLPKTIEHLAKQQVRPEIPWEIIIVDNASTDNTAQVAQGELRKWQLPVPYSVLHQPKPGLTFARELAYAHAEFEYILLCDDDNWLNSDYVNLAFDLMEQHPNIGALGGYGDLVYEEEPPYYATQLRLFANGHQAPQSGKVTKNIVYGAGCIIRKSAYYKLFQMGFTPLLTDRVASSLSSGGDYEMCYALTLIGYDIWYDARLTFKHYMVKQRQTWDYYLRYLQESAACFEVLDAYSLLATQGCKSEVTFNIHLFKNFLYYLKEISGLTYKKLTLDPASEEGKENTLRFLSTKTRLKGYKKYFTIRRNFLHLLEFVNNRNRGAVAK